MTHFATLVSLGCAKNLVDSEEMVSELLGLGYKMTSDPSEAHLILVNTCGFLESAVEESIENVLRLAAHKFEGSCRTLVVAGCMVQRYGKKLPGLLPEVDLFLGTAHYKDLGKALRTLEDGIPKKLWISHPGIAREGRTRRTLSTSPGSAYIKIAEGCSNRCTFCLIPKLRGPYRSRTAEDITEEAELLVSEGIVEINLVAQDTTAFGSDRNDPEALISLLQSLDRLEGLEWVRLLYAYPDRINKSFLRAMAESRKVVPYLDIPLQHCAPGILKDMQRESRYDSVVELISLVRSYLPDVSLRTSLIVGFPGETEEDFAKLLEFVESTEFDHLGVFSFSAEAGTRAARLSPQVDLETKERRREMLLSVQRGISRRRLRRFRGKILPILVEGPHPETDLLLSGRLATQAPEVDGTVLITSGSARPGEIIPGRITSTHDYDLEAELLPGSDTEIH